MQPQDSVSTPLLLPQRRPRAAHRLARPSPIHSLASTTSPSRYKPVRLRTMASRSGTNACTPASHLLPRWMAALRDLFIGDFGHHRPLFCSGVLYRARRRQRAEGADAQDRAQQACPGWRPRCAPAPSVFSAAAVLWSRPASRYQCQPIPDHARMVKVLGYALSDR